MKKSPFLLRWSRAHMKNQPSAEWQGCLPFHVQKKKKGCLPFHGGIPLLTPWRIYVIFSTVTIWHFINTIIQLGVSGNILNLPSVLLETLSGLRKTHSQHWCLVTSILKFVNLHDYVLNAAGCSWAGWNWHPGALIAQEKNIFRKTIGHLYSKPVGTVVACTKQLSTQIIAVTFTLPLFVFSVIWSVSVLSAGPSVSSDTPRRRPRKRGRGGPHPWVLVGPWPGFTPDP